LKQFYFIIINISTIQQIITAIFLGSSDEQNKQNEENSPKISVLNLTQEIPNIIQQSFQGVQKEIRILQNTTKDLHLMIRGIDGELQELKKVTKRISLKLDSFFDVGVKKAPKPHIKEISTGLDYLESIPPHLRETFQTILKRDKGATALQIAIETGKSRSLESDYLNQLENRGFIYKKRQGKKVLFFKIGEHEEEEEEDTQFIDHKKSLAYITEKQTLVNNAKNSHKKKATNIIIDDK